MDGPIQSVVVTFAPNFDVVACAVQLEHAGMSCARPLRALARMVLAATVWPPQLLSMSSTAHGHAVTWLYCLLDPTDRTV